MNDIDINRIIKITTDRIIYRDDRADTAFIELEPCANSWEKSHGCSKSGTVRCVGDRFFGEYAYYELYDIGHTHLSMKLKTNKLKSYISKITGWNFHTKNFQQYYSIQKALNANGWTTLDLS